MKRKILLLILVLGIVLIAGCKQESDAQRKVAEGQPGIVEEQVVPTVQIGEEEEGEFVIQEPKAEKTFTITIAERKANPLVAEVSKGTTVTWVNKDTNLGHVIIIEGLNNERKRINPGESYSYTFENTGNYRWLSQTNQFTSGYVNVK